MKQTSIHIGLQAILLLFLGCTGTLSEDNNRRLTEIDSQLSTLDGTSSEKCAEAAALCGEAERICEHDCDKVLCDTVLRRCAHDASRYCGGDVDGGSGGGGSDDAGSSSQDASSSSQDASSSTPDAMSGPDDAGMTTPADDGGTVDLGDLRAFPGAQGFGTDTVGGRGGRIIEVTNLNDSGPGSFRNAVLASGPRIVVFRVGGTIALDSRVEIDQPYLTIAGQTAPGDGITLRSSSSNRKGTMYIVTHDVIMRYIRLRPGTPGSETDSHDALTIWNSDDPDQGAYNIVVDHCSFSWAVDENLATYHNARDITFSWNITSEALSNSKHPEGEHSKGFHLSGNNSGNITVHHNLIAHNMDRNPQPTNPGIVDIRNNVVYNYGDHAMFVSNSKGKPSVNVVGNFYKPGPSTESGIWELEKYEGSSAGHAYYVKGNLGPNRTSDSEPEENFVEPDSRSVMVSSPFAAPTVSIQPAAQAYEAVLNGAGASFVRDAVDKRIVSDVRNGTGSIIDHENEVGGWPTLSSGQAPDDDDHDGMPNAWESARGLDPTSDDSAGDRDGDGYTNIEEYIYGLLL